MKIDFNLHKEIIDQKRKDIKTLCYNFNIKINEKEKELSELKQQLILIERPLQIEIESLYKERKEYIQRFVDDLDLIGEKVILPSKKVGIIKQTRISPKGNLIMEIEIKDDWIPYSKIEQHPYKDVLLYRDYLDEKLKKILE